MAQPPLFTRLLSAFRGTGSELAVATADPGPLKEASPEGDKAQPVGGMQTRAYDGFGIPFVWLSQIAVNDDTVLRREGSMDLTLFDALLDDDLTFSAFQQRRLALVSRPWEVEAGDESPAAKEAADHLRGQIARIGWDRICGLMHYGVWYGYAVGELLYGIGADSKVEITDIIVPDRRWFGFTNGGELRMKTPESMDGEAVALNKFWSYRSGATHDFAVYGTGLAHWVYWPVWFKKNVIKFWTLFLEKFGQPTVVGLLAKGESDPVRISEMLTVAKAVGRDSAVVVNAADDGKSPISVAEATRSGGAASSYHTFVEQMNDAILRVVLGQTMTAKSAAGGIGSNQSDTQKEVRDEIVRSDSDLLHESFNRGPARWLTAWNFGPDVAPPRVYRRMDDEEDLDTIADRDVKLAGIGIKRTTASIAEIYGDGYEYVEPVTPPMISGGKLGPDGKPVLALTDQRAKQLAEFAAMDPAPLYIYRPLLNTGPFIKWAKAQGFKNIAKDLHVPVVYSKTPVDWFEMTNESWGGDNKLTIGEGGPRRVEAFGPPTNPNAIVLHFGSEQLKWRNEGLITRGCSTDYAEYLSHVTITYDASDIDLTKVEPYTGPLIFGPEYFEEARTGGDDKPPAVDDVKFTADELDAIDALAASLADEADPVFAAMADHIRGNLKGVTTPQGLRIALLEAVETLPVDRLAKLSGLPFTAAHASAAAGVDDHLTA